MRAHEAAAQPNSGSSDEYLSDIDVFFGRRFEEKPPEFIGQRFSSFIRDFPLFNQITLVPDENNAVVQLWRAALFNIIFPATHVTKRSLLAWMRFVIAVGERKGKQNAAQKSRFNAAQKSRFKYHLRSDIIADDENVPQFVSSSNLQRM